MCVYPYIHIFPNIYIHPNVYPNIYTLYKFSIDTFFNDNSFIVLYFFSALSKITSGEDRLQNDFSVAVLLGLCNNVFRVHKVVFQMIKHQV